MAKRNKVVHHGAIGTPEGNYFSAVPQELARDKKLSPYAKGVAIFIWSHKSTYTQSVVSVAGDMGANSKTVAKALIELQRRRWLIRERVMRPGNKSPSSEIWHLQMLDFHFGPEEIRRLGGPDAPGLAEDWDDDPAKSGRGSTANLAKRRRTPSPTNGEGTSPINGEHSRTTEDQLEDHKDKEEQEDLSKERRGCGADAPPSRQWLAGLGGRLDCTRCEGCFLDEGKFEKHVCGKTSRMRSIPLVAS